MNIYVASSWKNQRQPLVVALLREWGHDAYDFRNPNPGDKGFNWGWLGPKSLSPESWSPSEYLDVLEDPLVEGAFRHDLNAMDWAEACVLVLPCGRSAHFEAGWFAGKGKPVIGLLEQDKVDPEIMHKMMYLVQNVESLQRTLAEL